MVNSENDLNNDNLEKNKTSKKIIIIRLVFIILLIASLIYFIIWFYDNKKNKELHDSLNNYISVNPNDTQSLIIDFEKLKMLNNDIYAWLTVNGTSINYPIVHPTNNDYYLNHAFDNSFNNSGCPFIDYRAKCDGTDKNLVIYGHNRRDRKYVCFT